MSALDWVIVLALNGAVIAYGMFLARGTRTSSDWFLGGRALPWWAIGMSMFATNVDSADIVAVTGSTYNEGLHIVTVYAIGSAVGGVLAAFLVTPTIYRQGFYTNAEYLEARFGPSVRLISAVIQLQYRSSMLGLMIVSMHLLLTRLVQLDNALAWMLIVLAVLFSGAYTAAGGLRSVVFTDALQGVVMLIGGAVIFVTVFQAVGGWESLTEKLREVGREDMLHVGRYRGASGRLSPLVVVMGWSIIGAGYWTVNHTQTMRLMGARSVWDMKLAASFGVLVSLPIMVACACLGVLGRAIPAYANLENADELYPLMANEYLESGFKGVVVAGVVAACVSTFDSMGSALSAVFTRDIYARFIRRDASDSHYVLVGRVATVGVLTLGFLYLPFIFMQENMLKAFTTLIPVLVTPLFTIYLLGVATRVHRASGLVGLIVGSIYGFLALIDRDFYDIDVLPFWFSERWAALGWSVLLTSIAVGVTTWLLGPLPRGAVMKFRETGWLERSREALPKICEYPE
ncbi:MAG TPA: hypothetical protein DCY79_21640, partial [Planctomycetaceae bacterium]|nr:hypothetical protein [Planctomycetaceae bacterium]